MQKPQRCDSNRSNVRCAPLGTQQARTDLGAGLLATVRGAGYFQRVVMRKPTNMMPKPMAMFHGPIDSMGSIEPEM